MLSQFSGQKFIHLSVMSRQHVAITLGTNLQRYTTSDPEEHDLSKRTK